MGQSQTSGDHWFQAFTKVVAASSTRPHKEAKHRHRTVHTHTSDNLDLAIRLTRIDLDSGMKPDNPEQNPSKHMENNQTPHIEAPGPGFELASFLLDEEMCKPKIPEGQWFQMLSKCSATIKFAFSHLFYCLVGNIAKCQDRVHMNERSALLHGDWLVMNRV